MVEALRINLVLGHQLPFPPIQGGGVNNLLWLLARKFTKMGHSVTAYSPAAAGLPKNEYDEFSIRHVRVAGAPMRRGMWRNNVSGFPYAMRVWRELKPADVTSFHAPFSFVLQYKQKIGVCTHTIHRSPKWIIRLYKRMDRIYAGSYATVTEASVIAAGITDRLRAIHNCVEVSETLPPCRDAFDSRLRLIYVGRFTPDKGLCALIGGSIDALRMGHNICVTTVGPQTNDEGGDSEFYHAMNQLVVQNGAAEHFQFMPNIRDRARLFGLIDDHDVFCLPSLSGETLSIAALEAMSRAKPLLTSNYGPLREMVVDGVSGFVLEAGNRRAWANGIARIAGKRGMLREMGRASWLKARKEFSVEVIAEQYIRDFWELIERKKEA